MTLPPLVLASASPRRRELLAYLGAPFTVHSAEVEESAANAKEPGRLAVRLAENKAAAIDAPGAMVLAADTIVVLDDEILGKPTDGADAECMLVRLGGRSHLVMTGLVLDDRSSNRQVRTLASTLVKMRAYTLQEIAAYVATGDPLDKAGAYAIQDSSFHPAESLQGCYTNVVGLPLCHLYRLSAALGYELPVHPTAGCPWMRAHGCVWVEEILQYDPMLDF
ncbi:MAG: septum formation protein Maf [Chloroflexi bacterium]|nr:septum formation protein Maf [Chloroflexota bacterium]